MSFYIDRIKIINTLKKCGVKKNDILFVQSDVSKIGKLKGTLKQQLKTYLEAIKSSVGDNGTIVVPAFYYEYSRKKLSFNVSESPVSKELGLFPNFFCKQKNVFRSLNPLTSVAAMGKKAKYICGGNTATGFGLDSPFDRLTKLKAKILLIGVGDVTYVHYVEYMVGVPHIYNKLFEIPIYRQGKKINLPVCNQVRYLDYDVMHLKPKEIQKKLEKADLVKKVKLGNEYFRILSVEKVFNFLKIKLQKNFYYLLKKKPKFKKNSIPLI